MLITQRESQHSWLLLNSCQDVFFLSFLIFYDNARPWYFNIFLVLYDLRRKKDGKIYVKVVTRVIFKLKFQMSLMSTCLFEIRTFTRGKLGRNISKEIFFLLMMWAAELVLKKQHFVNIIIRIPVSLMPEFIPSHVDCRLFSRRVWSNQVLYFIKSDVIFFFFK